MTNRDLASLGFKLMAVFFLIYQVAYLGATIQQVLYAWRLTRQGMESNSFEMGSSLIFLALAGTVIMLGVAFLIKADRIAELVVPRELDLPIVSGVGPELLLVLALTALGALQLAIGGMGLVEWLVVKAFVQPDERGAFSLPTNPTYLGAIEPVLRVAVGSAFVFAPRWIIEKLRLPRG
ncbi:MAG: hypothetical protein H6534_03010 [Chthonomonadaceae bacterium]|nr:hypothetical protein [Chthonomonadaceae bacterium]